MNGDENGTRTRKGPPRKSLSHLTTISLKPSCSQEHDATPPQEGPQAQFYKEYHKVAEEYDKEFLKKYGEDLNGADHREF